MISLLKTNCRVLFAIGLAMAAVAALVKLPKDADAEVLSATADDAPTKRGPLATSCYDSKRHRIYIGGGSYPVAPADGQAFWVFDLTTNTWINPEPKGSPCRGSNSYPTKNAVMVYDPSNDRVLLILHSFHDDQPERLGVYVYDPNTNAWADEALRVPEKLGHNRQAKNGFFDPQLGAVFLHSAGDSRDDGSIWVYRYRQAGR